MPPYLAKDKTQNTEFLVKYRQLSHSAVNSSITGQVINTAQTQNMNKKSKNTRSNIVIELAHSTNMLHLLLLLSAAVLAQVLHHPHHHSPFHPGTS